VYPERLLNAGFVFKFGELEAAADALIHA